MDAAPGGLGVERGDALRLRMVEAEAAGGMGEPDLLRVALQQAVAALCGFGGLVHLAGEEGVLRLAVANGLPAGLARRWDEVASQAATAPSLAVSRGRVVWSPRWPEAGQGGGPGAEGVDEGGWAPTEPAGEVPGGAAGAVGVGDVPGGVVAAPILVGGMPIGAVSVLVAEAPDIARQGFLGQLAQAVGRRLTHTRQPRSGTAPWWQEPFGVREQVMRQISVGTWSWDLDSGLLDVDDVTEKLIPAAGLDPATWDHRIETWMERIHPDDRPGVQEAIETALATGQPYAVEYRVVGADRSISWLELRAAVDCDETGRALRMSGTAWNVTARHSQAAWLVGLIEQHPDPIYVLSADDRVQWINQAARDQDGGTGADLLGEIPWEKLPRLAGQGIPELLARARATPGQAVTTQMTYDGPDREMSSWTVRAVDVGGFVAAQLADVTAQKAAEMAQADRSRRMAELNAALIRALGTEQVVAALTRHVLPMFGAEGLIVHDLSEPVPRLVAATGYSAEFRAELEAPGWPVRLAEVTASPQPRFFSTPAELEAAWPTLAPLARHGGKSAWAVLPLSVNDRRVGSCIISWSAPRPFHEYEKSLLGTIAVIIAQALAKARLYEEARHRAERLQEELMPGTLPPTVGVRTAARYRLAAGEEVGGDWYDTIPLPGGRTLAIIGDVRGHGLEQAIAMGILRHAALTVATLDLPVDEIMAHLNDAAGRLGPLTATCMLVLYDATTGECSVAGAGHPPPVLLTPGGKAHEAELSPGQPLGQASVPAPVSGTELADGSVLVLYSDGLVDGTRRDVTPLTELLTRYGATAPLPQDVERRDAWLDTLCETIAEQLPPDPGRVDDAALMALATSRVPPERIAAWDLPWEPESARLGRSLAADRIDAWGLGELADTATLVVSELIGNAVRHAVGIGADVADDRAGVLRLRLLHLADGELTCEVYDGSQATPRVRHPLLDDEFGRGLQLVAVTAERWGTRYTEGGKCIWATVTDV
ncbi:SpoIIE family protein phosphatase [Actinacidiphila epipremni]|uniref:SpoIIE family protein phosphatase n=1 Tax=Actinacidiphila epipremni TaxID=2053013 RepID=A0ABX0ZJU0_9ACTN|nr:SpoIIE family protein phosphatase [Actinacidiphila epipremni]NJP42474.1 SpoIIE family protein phosphatase [Actinacidiphila epipremni]